MSNLQRMDVLKKYHKEGLDKELISNLLKREIACSDEKIIVLDDDPTGVQTVHNVYVYTDWSVESIRNGFLQNNKVFFVLTNSRGLTESQTEQLHLEIGKNILQVSRELKMHYLIISRSDSTLRGHYPLETQTLKDCIERFSDKRIDGEIVIPFFKEGGRYTIDNIHYVDYEGTLHPAAETEFARDTTFSFRNSDLPLYIEEKTKKNYVSQSVTCISLESLRNQDFDGILNQLIEVTNFNKIIVNAIDDIDLNVFCIALYRAMKRGKYYIFRTAASFVKALGGFEKQALLKKEEMVMEKCGNKIGGGGIVIAGSHTAKTTEQLEVLSELTDCAFAEFHSDLILNDRLDEEVERVCEICCNSIKNGMTIVVYTNRKVLSLKDDTPEVALMRAIRISEALQSIVKNLSICPKFIVAKGGITSNDIGVKALQVKKAIVLGQIKPGIPVWRTDKNSKFPEIPFVIFPGNVGTRETLKEVVEILIDAHDEKK